MEDAPTAWNREMLSGNKSLQLSSEGTLEGVSRRGSARKDGKQKREDREQGLCPEISLATPEKDVGLHDLPAAPTLVTWPRSLGVAHQSCRASAGGCLGAGLGKLPFPTMRDGADCLERPSQEVVAGLAEGV